MNRKPERVDWYLLQIRQMWPDFQDDGLSCFPDWIYKYILRLNITPAGRVRDWHYCTRCHPIGTMNQKARLFADRALRQHAKELLRWERPSGNRFVRFLRAARSRIPRLAPRVLYRGVRLGGGGSAWNSCGPEQGDRCRHNIKQPVWMRALGGA